jgi:hypothetical protein
MAKLGQILLLLNTLAIAAVLGLFVYTKVIFKRPSITESKERVKLAQQPKPAPWRRPLAGDAVENMLTYWTIHMLGLGSANIGES